jgi:hypothetical protein
LAISRHIPGEAEENRENMPKQPLPMLWFAAGNFSVHVSALALRELVRNAGLWKEIAWRPAHGNSVITQDLCLAHSVYRNMSRGEVGPSVSLQYVKWIELSYRKKCSLLSFKEL